MSDEVKVGTCGFDHVGLSVRDLAFSRKFFCDCLGWRVVGERPDYPAAFVSDGRGVLSEKVELDTKGSASGFHSNARQELIAFHRTPGYETYAGLGWHGVIIQDPRA